MRDLTPLPLRVDRLLLVLGPPSSGKSWFIDLLRDPAERELARCVGIGEGDAAGWPLVTAVMLDDLSGKTLERGIVHYGLSVPLRAHLSGEDVDFSDRRWPRHSEILDLFAAASERAVVVVWASPATLHRRTLDRLRRVWFRWDRLRNPLGFVERVRKLRRRERLFRRRGDRLLSFYERLIDWCEAQPETRVFIFDSTSDAPRLLDAKTWRAERLRDSMIAPR